MIVKHCDVESLTRTGVFTSRIDMIYYLILSILHKIGSPVGSWMLRAELDEYGVSSSVATIGRYLKDLDSMGCTEQKSNQGRVLTPVGEDRLRDLDTLLARAQSRLNLTEALWVERFGQLVDLVRVRRALEIESARQAALRATKEDLVLIREALEEHKRTVREGLDPNKAAMDFHFAIAKASYNIFAIALLEMLITEESYIEAKFPYLLTRELGNDYVADHVNLVEAIENGDHEWASKLMDAHMSKIVYDLKRQEDNIDGSERPKSPSVI